MSNGNQPLVKFKDVQKTYDGEILVVKDLNLDIDNGEFLTILGPSGSGKTTCLMMLAGFENPTQGQIMLGDMELNNMPPHKRGIGMVFQNYALFPHMSVAENLAFPLEVRKMSKAETDQKVKEPSTWSNLALSLTGVRRSCQAANSSVLLWPALWCSSRILS